jgi:hypothetical protein
VRRGGCWQGRARIGFVWGEGNGLSELTASAKITPRDKPRNRSPTASLVREGGVGCLRFVGIASPIRMESPQAKAITATGNGVRTRIGSRLAKCHHLLGLSGLGRVSERMCLVDLLISSSL